MCETAEIAIGLIGAEPPHGYLNRHLPLSVIRRFKSTLI